MAQPISGPSYNVAQDIVKSDTVDIPGIAQYGPPVAIWVGGAGVVQAVMFTGQVIAFTCVAGTTLPISCKRVNSGSTTATLLVALWAT